MSASAPRQKDKYMLRLYVTAHTSRVLIDFDLRADNAKADAGAGGEANG